MPSKPAVVFVSFKTDPDLSRAESLAASLRKHGITTTFLQGDIGCPHPQGSEGADRWLSKFLDDQSFTILLSVASQSSMRSKWVFQEVFRALTSAKLILLLWIDGPNPLPHFFPGAKGWYRFFPTTATTYLIDCRDRRNAAAEVSAKVANGLDQIVSLRRKRRALVATILIVCLALLLALPLADKAPTDSVELAIYVEHVKSRGMLLIVAVAALGAFVWPSAFVLPRSLQTGPLAKTTRVTSSFTVMRWSYLLWILLMLLTGIKLGALPNGILGAFLAVSVPGVARGVMKSATRRSYRIVDEMRSTPV